ncbi:hypothetical protein [Pseudalkalibacillus caeni]|uniref:DinB-like domain-containing protein n=1 Tax=Exobacillus caeni TaxID=2574798 RepID=A0A5R9F6W0_9BACL|nr:hypothetical protein [Pseudalkalibacillus caeni]TLS38249.1 hypothetical protein FCL54_06860 [Pseudalkalibacillus caeni]
MLTNRLPYLKGGEPLPASEADLEKETNQKAEAYAHSGISLNKLFGEVIAQRKKVVAFLESLSDEDFYKENAIGGKAITIEGYIKRLSRHDEHHILQIKEAFKNNTMVSEGLMK